MIDNFVIITFGVWFMALVIKGFLGDYYKKRENHKMVFALKTGYWIISVIYILLLILHYRKLL